MLTPIPRICGEGVEGVPDTIPAWSRRRSAVITSLALGTLTFAGPAVAGTPDETTKPARHWAITIPLWVPGYRGEFSIGGIEVDGESQGGTDGGFLARLFDRKTRLNFFFMGAASYTADRWRIYADAFGGKFTSDVVFTLTDGTITTATVQPTIASLSATYRAYERPWGDSASNRWQTWVYTGLRVYDARLEVDLVRRYTSASTWVDPVVGVWIPVDVARRWRVSLWGDMGGFGLGSKLSWHASALGSFQIGPLVEISLGYNVVDVNYHATVASEDFIMKIRVGGPMAGVGFRF